jgi:hypothetical protein
VLLLLLLLLLLQVVGSLVYFQLALVVSAARILAHATSY